MSISDLYSSLLGISTNHVSLSQIVVPESSSARMLIRPYSFTFLLYEDIWVAKTCNPGPVIINLGLEHCITGVFCIGGYTRNIRTKDVTLSFSDDGIIWDNDHSLDDKVRVRKSYLS